MLSRTSMVNTTNKANLLPRLKLALMQVLLFLMIFVPRTQQNIKLAILLVLFAVVIIEVLVTGKIKINQVTRIFMTIFLVYASISGAIGLLKDNPGASDFIRVNIIYYILFAIIISFVATSIQFERLTKTIIFSSIAVSIYSILLLLVSLGVWPPHYFYTFDVTSNVGIHSGYIHLTNTNLSMMIFILPYIMTLRLNNYNFKTIKVWQLTLAFILGTIAVLISGRRILWLSFLIPLYFYLVKTEKGRILHTLKKKFIIIIAIVIFITALSFSSYFSLEEMMIRFNNVFIGVEGNIRISQINALWQGFLQNPILGSGAGIGVTEVIRNQNAPWIYEMSYNLILYNSGIIGVILFSSSFLYLLSRLYKEKIKGDTLAEALLIAYVTVLISNATNPYFSSSFDFIWFIFFPLMYFNIKTTQLKEGGRKV